MMGSILDWMGNFLSSYNTDIVKGQVIPFFGGGDGLLILLCAIWCLIYAVGFSIARHKKTNMNAGDISGSFFGGGFVFCLVSILLLVGGAFIVLALGIILSVAIPSVSLYFITSMIMKGLDARKQIDT